MLSLKENERLVYAGETALRAPDGTPLESVPQFMIVPTEKADPEYISELKDNERLVLAGRVFNNIKTAEERFAALLAGREPSPSEEGEPLYIKENAANVNPETGHTRVTENALTALAGDLLATFSMQMRKIRAEERKYKTGGRESNE